MEKMTSGKLIFRKLILFSAIFCPVFFSSSGAQVLQRATSGESSAKVVISKYLSKIDTLFVIHFHPTVQCSCCINVGSFARKGLEQFYAKAYKDSSIIFREYDIDEDSSTAKRYNISWSALGFEKFLGNKNEFKEIESVWEFCEDEEKFLLNFKKELDEFIIRERKSTAQSKSQDKKTE
jgi:hypothetical protein